jgi:hypothetical protein
MKSLPSVTADAEGRPAFLAMRPWHRMMAALEQQADMGVTGALAETARLNPHRRSCRYQIALPE